MKTSLLQSPMCFWYFYVCVVLGFMYYFSQSFRQKCITYFVIFGCCQAGSRPNAWMPLNNLWTQRCVALLTLWLGSCEIRYLSNINLSPCPRPATCHYSAFDVIKLHLSVDVHIRLFIAPWRIQSSQTLHFDHNKLPDTRLNSELQAIPMGKPRDTVG